MDELKDDIILFYKKSNKKIEYDDESPIYDEIDKSLHHLIEEKIHFVPGCSCFFIPLIFKERGTIDLKQIEFERNASLQAIKETAYIADTNLLFGLQEIQKHFLNIQSIKFFTHCEKPIELKKFLARQAKCAKVRKIYLSLYLLEIC